VDESTHRPSRNFSEPTVVRQHLNVPKPAAGEPRLSSTETNTLCPPEFFLFFFFPGGGGGGPPPQRPPRLFARSRPEVRGTNVPATCEFPSQVNEMWMLLAEILRELRSAPRDRQRMPHGTRGTG